MLFRENLQIFRKSNHLSQEKLAQKLGVSRQSVSKWETGEAYPEMTNILALCTVFHCRIIDLIDINSQDFNSFDLKTRKDLVSLTKKDQKRLKNISKIIYVAARIGRIISLSNFAIIGAVAWTIRWGALNWLFLGAPEWASWADINFINLFRFGIFPRALVLIFILVLFVIASVCVYKLLHEVERFFVRIHNSNSPFSLENTISLKRVAKYTIIWLVTDSLAKLICIFVIPGADLKFNAILVIYALITVAFVYVFRYGYLLQESHG